CSADALGRAPVPVEQARVRSAQAAAQPPVARAASRRRVAPVAVHSPVAPLPHVAGPARVVPLARAAPLPASGARRRPAALLAAQAVLREPSIAAVLRYAVPRLQRSSAGPGSGPVRFARARPSGCVAARNDHAAGSGSSGFRASVAARRSSDSGCRCTDAGTSATVPAQAPTRGSTGPT